MTTSRSYVADNDAQRARLEALVARLSDAELQRPMAAGWTVAGVLAHIAFWDQRAIVLLERWQKQGVVPPPEAEGQVDWINDAGKPLFLALPPRRAAELAVAAAREADERARALPDELVAKNASVGTPVQLVRALHRREHLDEIERALRNR
jgi:uncharacterized damage-inducible protein DinB